MADTVIDVRDVSKKYTIRHLSKNLKNSPQNNNFSKEVDFWALQDISFEVEEGAVWGIIGKNGAGKSTLLKLLSKITTPTSGIIKIKGKIGSLLEVGTGFHRELSGRENIFLNGSILGMKRIEIKEKLAEIVDFAGIEEFLDEPVKHYSSGMYSRLAFAVAAHLDTQILIVDEVLAVGDVEFQKKCLGKMETLSTGEGKTVLFVSHNLRAISQITQKTILLNQGKIQTIGESNQVIHQYMETLQSNTWEYEDLKEEFINKIKKVSLQTSHPANTQASGQLMRIHLTIQAVESLRGVRIGVGIFNYLNERVLFLASDDPSDTIQINLEKGVHYITCTIPTLHLYQGKYTLSVHFVEYFGGRKFQVLEDLCPFEVVMLDKLDRNDWQKDLCYYFEDCSWSVNENQVFHYAHNLGFFYE